MDVQSYGLIKQMASLSAEAKGMCPEISTIINKQIRCIAEKSISDHEAFRELGKIPSYGDFKRDPCFRKAYYLFCSKHPDKLFMVSIKAGNLKVDIPYETLRVRAKVLAAALKYREGNDKEINLSEQYQRHKEFQNEYHDFFNFLKGEPVKINKNNFAFLMKLALEYGSDELIVECGLYCCRNIENFDCDSLNFIWTFAEEVNCHSWQLNILRFLKRNRDLVGNMNPECQNQFAYFERCFLKFNADASWSMNIYSDRDLNYFISIFSDCHFLRRCAAGAKSSSRVVLGYIQNSKRLKTLLQKNEDNPLFSGLSLNLKPLLAGESGDILSYIFNQTTLCDLSLVGNNIDDDEAESIAAFLEKNKSLKKLVLCCNNIGGSGAERLVEAMEKNSHLACLDLSSNPIDGDTLERLQEKNISGLIPT